MAWELLEALNRLTRTETGSKAMAGRKNGEKVSRAGGERRRQDVVIFGR